MSQKPQLPYVDTRDFASNRGPHDKIATAVAIETKEDPPRRRIVPILVGGSVTALFLVALSFWIFPSDTHIPRVLTARETSFLKDAQSSVRKRISFPETATFENIVVDIDSDPPQVIGEVIATNAFGVPIRKRFAYANGRSVLADAKY